MKTISKPTLQVAGFIAAFLLVGPVSLAIAAGITIGNGASVTLSGLPTVTTVDLTISGTLSGGGGTINVKGNWTNSNTFTSGTGTVAFNGTGTQNINSGGITDDKDFYNLAFLGSTTIVPVTNDIKINSNLTLSNTATLSNTNNKSFSIAGNVQVASGNTWSKGTGTITLAGTSGTQTINFAGKSVEDIVIDALGATKQFTGSVTTDSFSATNGTLDFNGQSITSSGNFTIGVGSQVIADADAMNGADINVGGNLNLDGENGDKLAFNWTSAWSIDVANDADMDYISFNTSNTNAMTLTVSGANATASYTDVEYSDASGGTTIDATDGTNINNGNNPNWQFNIISVTLRDSNDTADYATWVLGSGKDLDTVYIMNNTECVLVKNNGNIAEDFSISAVGTSWTLSNATGLDTAVLMGLFNGNSAPSTGDFSTIGDLISGTTVWSTYQGDGSGKYQGTGDGDNVAASSGEKLYIYLKTPSSLTQGSQESITVTVGCREH